MRWVAPKGFFALLRGGMFQSNHGFQVVRYRWLFTTAQGIGHKLQAANEPFIRFVGQEFHCRYRTFPVSALVMPRSTTIRSVFFDFRCLFPLSKVRDLRLVRSGNLSVE